MVALHGLGSGAMPLGPVLAHLKSHFGRIIAPDMPGHGFSDAPEALSVQTIYAGILSLLEQTLEGRALFFGHSLGGAVSLRIALERPDLVNGLALLSPAGAPTPASEHERWMERFQMVNQEAAAEFVRRLYVDTPACYRWSPDCRRLFRRARCGSSWARRGAFTLTPEQLSSITVPIHLLG